MGSRGSWPGLPAALAIHPAAPSEELQGPPLPQTPRTACMFEREEK